MKFIAVAGALLVAAGCSTSPISSQEASAVPSSRLHAFTRKQESTLVVTRDTGILGAACNYKLYIDGTFAAEFGSGETAAFGIKAGSHVLGIAAAAPCGGAGLLESEVFVTAGQIAKRRIYINQSGFHLTPTSY
jgi:hypothetical protein